MERVDALDPLRLLLPDGSPQMYWAVPTRGYELAGIGSAVELTGAGAWRFPDVGRAWQQLRSDAMVSAPDDAIRGSGPVVMGGFSFDPTGPESGLWRGFGAASFVVPQLSLARRDDVCWFTLSALVEPDSDVEEVARVLATERSRVRSPGTPVATPRAAADIDVPDDAAAHARWRGLVDTAVAAIRAGTMEKVVVARSVDVALDHDGAFDPLAALAHFRDTQPGAFIFGVWRGDAVFLGATPERLATVRDGVIETSVLAGSAPRGTTPALDADRVRALRESAKDREEHEIVRREIHDLLRDSCGDVVSASEPSVVTLPNVHHLHTAVHARLRPGHTALEVLERLHPTPAVGGAPRDAALAFIRRHEGLDRGWYAAPLGWMDRHDAEFAVALRSALVRGSVATLFAGCGIVAPSEPDAELQESAVKLRTALGAVRAGASRRRA